MLELQSNEVTNMDTLGELNWVEKWVIRYMSRWSRVDLELGFNAEVSSRPMSRFIGSSLVLIWMASMVLLQ